MTALERRVVDQARAVLSAETIFGFGSAQHRRQVSKLVRLQRQLPPL